MAESRDMWQRARSSSKAGFDKLYGWVDKLGPPVNNLSNKLGSEAFWPTTLDKECEKAARILRSFCKDGFLEKEDENDVLARKSWDSESNAPRKNHSKVLKSIPQDVIRKARGLAIFTTMRTGLWVSGASGSGVLIARLADGSWSCPSGIMLHTAGVGFLVGIDVYDCVVVLNTDEAVKAFSAVRCTLGGELSAVAGPIGIGGVLDSEVHKRQAPLFTYLKSRGFYAGVQLDGTIVIERSDENERFYHRRIPVAEIIAGKISYGAPIEAQRLLQTVKMAQGDTDVEVSMLTTEAPPSDFDVASGQVFGVPGREDPDPYGVLALEKEGLVIREAGTRKAASRESFQFLPSPSSPLFSAFNQSWDRRASLDMDSKRSSWRTSFSNTPEASTTDLATGNASFSRPQSGNFVSVMAGIPEMDSIDKKLVDHKSSEASEEDITEAFKPANLPSHIESVLIPSPAELNNSVEVPNSAEVPSPTEENPNMLSVLPPSLPPRDRMSFLPPPPTPSLRNRKVAPPRLAEAPRLRGPALPARPEKGNLILQEQLAMAEQLRQLISPRPELKKTASISSIEEVLATSTGSLEVASASPTPFADAVEEQQSPTHDDDVVVHPAANAVHVSEEVAENSVIDSVPQHTPDLTESVDGEEDVDADDEDSDFGDDDDDDVVFHEVVTTIAPRIINASPQFMAKARLIDVTMPTTPTLPSRNPRRVRASQSHAILRPELEAVDHDQRSVHSEPRASSPASSVYSAKEEIVSSTRGSESIASHSSHDDVVTPLQLPSAVQAKASPAVDKALSPAL